MVDDVEGVEQDESPADLPHQPAELLALGLELISMGDRLGPGYVLMARWRRSPARVNVNYWVWYYFVDLVLRWQWDNTSTIHQDVLDMSTRMYSYSSCREAEDALAEILVGLPWDRRERLIRECDALTVAAFGALGPTA